MKQHTGIPDADGRPIVEGDVLLYAPNDRRTYQRIVVWDEAEQQFMARAHDGTRYHLTCYGKSVRVLGNVHDGQEEASTQ